MLRRDREPRQRSFADQARAARAVPDDHVLMRMKRAADWNAVEDALAGYYDAHEGRLSYPPAVLVRMLVVEQYADLSDREAHEQVGYNLLYRAFVGLGADEAVPDDTTLVVFRKRIGAEGVGKVFALLNRQWEAAGLIAGDRRVIDGAHLWAKVARRSWVSLMRQGRTLIVEAVAADQLVCPEGKRSIGKVRVNQGDLYYFSTKDCNVCPRRDDCLTRGEREGKAMPRRRVYLSDVRKQKVVAGETGRAWRKDQLRVRGRIEAKFDEQMNRHGLRRARYWGLAKVTAQVLLNAITVNLKRAAKLLAHRAAAPPGATLVPAGAVVEAA